MVYKILHDAAFACFFRLSYPLMLLSVFYGSLCEPWVFPLTCLHSGPSTWNVLSLALLLVLHAGSKVNITFSWNIFLTYCSTELFESLHYMCL